MPRGRDRKRPRADALRDATADEAATSWRTSAESMVARASLGVIGADRRRATSARRELRDGTVKSAPVQLLTTASIAEDARARVAPTGQVAEWSKLE